MLAHCALTLCSLSPWRIQVHKLLEAVTRVHTLEVGDIVLTGTPDGVGSCVPGDVITAGIEGLPVDLETAIVPSSAPQ